MDLPKIRKQFTDLLPSTKDLFSTSKRLGAGVLFFVVGAFTSSSSPQAPATPTDTPSISAEAGMRTPKVKLVLKQGNSPTVLHAMHYSHQSHESHYSHYSHRSHYSHYSSRY